MEAQRRVELTSQLEGTAVVVELVWRACWEGNTELSLMELMGIKRWKVRNWEGISGKGTA